MSHPVTRKLHMAVLLGISAAFGGCVAGHSKANVLYITEKPDPTPLLASVGTTIDVKLSKMRWTEIRASDEQTPIPVLRRTASPTPSEDGKAAVTFVAEHPGKVTLMAQGRANCSPGQACPHFLLQWSRTIEVVDSKP